MPRAPTRAGSATLIISRTGLPIRRARSLRESAVDPLRPQRYGLKTPDSRAAVSPTAFASYSTTVSWRPGPAPNRTVRAKPLAEQRLPASIQAVRPSAICWSGDAALPHVPFTPATGVRLPARPPGLGPLGSRRARQSPYEFGARPPFSPASGSGPYRWTGLNGPSGPG